MSDLGFRTVYRYYCINDKKWITEERAEGSPPTVCLEDAGHDIKNGTISIVRTYLKIKRIDQVNLYNTCDLTNIDAFTVVRKFEALAQRCRALEEVLQKNNFVRFI